MTAPGSRPLPLGAGTHAYGVFLEIEDEGLRQRLKLVADRSAHPVGLYTRIHAHQRAESGLMFRQLRKGGSRRGVYWPWFSPQYFRQTDKVLVPAQGGVRKLRGKGMVKGRLRPSRQRVTASSNLMRDRGILANAVATVRRIKADRVEIATPVTWAVWQQAMRPFSFFTRDDLRLYKGWAAEELLKE